MSEKAKSTSKKQFKSMFYKKSSKPLKKPKLSVVFDESARVDFLTGFHKRKLQRKTDQKLKLEKQLAAEKQRIRAQAKKSVGKLCSSHSILPEVEHLLNMSSAKLEPSESTSQSITMGTKIVTISSLDNIHMKLPPMKEEESDNAAEDNEEANANDNDVDTPAKGGNNVKSLLKKATNRLLQSSKAYKTSQKIKQKNKKRKSRKNPNFVLKRDGNKKGDDSKGANPSFRKGKKGQKKKGKS